jgi:hypothetical protein
MWAPHMWLLASRTVGQRVWSRCWGCLSFQRPISSAGSGCMGAWGAAVRLPAGNMLVLCNSFQPHLGCEAAAADRRWSPVSGPAPGTFEASEAPIAGKRCVQVGAGSGSWSFEGLFGLRPPPAFTSPPHTRSSASQQPRDLAGPARRVHAAGGQHQRCPHTCMSRRRGPALRLALLATLLASVSHRAAGGRLPQEGTCWPAARRAATPH